MKKLFLVLPFFLFTSFLAPKAEKRFAIEITTDYGVIKIMLYNETPLHRDNMLKLVREGFYDSLLFHRVISQFMIQGGDPESKYAAAGQMLGNGEIAGMDRIPNEWNEKFFHKKGALAAARDDNPENASSNCQFYIVQGQPFTEEQIKNFETQYGGNIPAAHREVYKTIGGTPHLDLLKFTVFGEVYQGLNVVDSIAAVKTSGRNFGDRPVKDMRMFIQEVKRVKLKP